MSTKGMCVVVALALAAMAGSAVAATEQDVTLTVTIQTLGVSVSPATYDFGMMTLDEPKRAATPLVVTNAGNVAEDVGLRIKDEDDRDEWTSFAGEGPPTTTNQYKMGALLIEIPEWGGTVLTTAVQWADGVLFLGGGNDMAASATENLWIWIHAPPSVSGAHAADQHTITVEVSCRLAE